VAIKRAKACADEDATFITDLFNLSLFQIISKKQ